MNWASEIYETVPVSFGNVFCPKGFQGVEDKIVDGIHCVLNAKAAPRETRARK